jgi:hypothetical protein
VPHYVTSGKGLNGKCSNMKSIIFWDGMACSPVDKFTDISEGYTFIFRDLLAASFFFNTFFDWPSHLKI